MKRILLFAATNLAVLALLSIVVRLLGIDRQLAQQGLGADGLLVFAAAIGFGGALLSLAMSRLVAQAMLGVKLIRQPATQQQGWLVEVVHAHARRAGLAPPDVGIFESPAMNAFATGARRDRALVAVSSGLLRGMSAEEFEAVLGHEITHVANGDMVTLALLQGVLNTFVIFLARAFGSLIDNAIVGGNSDRRRWGSGPAYFFIVIALQLVLGLFANLIVMAFSRQREFRADAGGARLAGTGSMIAALERLGAQHDAPLPGQFSAFGISGRMSPGLQRLFMSHPPIAERIAALRSQRYG